MFVSLYIHGDVTFLMIVSQGRSFVVSCPLVNLFHYVLISMVLPSLFIVQAEAAVRFLTVMMNYLESLCSDLRSHTITSVQSNNDRVG